MPPKQILIILTSFGTLTAGEFALSHKIPTRITVEGEVLGATLLKEIDDLLYIYSNNDGSITIFTKSGDYYGTICPGSIGRGGYLGDDFTTINDTLYFLNTVDNRIEQFLLPSGRWLNSITLPRTLFAHESPRNQLPLSISVIEEELYIGNRENLRPLSGGGIRISLAKSNRSRTIVEKRDISYRLTTDSLIGEPHQ